MFTGQGEVLDGGTLVAKVKYTVDVVHHFDDSSSTQSHAHEKVAGLPTYECEIDGLPQSVPFGPFTLVMSDGKKLSFVLREGRIQVVSGIY